MLLVFGSTRHIKMAPPFLIIKLDFVTEERGTSIDIKTIGDYTGNYDSSIDACFIPPLFWLDVTFNCAI
jgi:hypothetical protein